MERKKSVAEEGLKYLERMMCQLDKILHSPSVNNVVCRRIGYLVEAVYKRSIRDRGYLEHVFQMVVCVMSDLQAATKAKNFMLDDQNHAAAQA